MPSTNWKYVDNQFDVATKDSYKKMSILAPDHLARLEAGQADPDVAVLLTRTNPVVLNYMTKYSSRIAVARLYKGSTASVDSLLETLKDVKTKQWDAQVQSVHLEGTPDYIAIFPSGRTPFQTGGKDQRILEVAALEERLTGYAALAATRTDVHNFYVSINTARDTQQQKEGTVGASSDDLEEARLAVAVMFYGNLGVLMDKFKDNPLMITRFWQLSLFRDTNGDVIMEETIGGGDIMLILSGGFDDTTKFEISNPGLTPLRFFTDVNPTGDTGTGLVLNPNETRTVVATDMGHAGNTILKVINLDGINEGTWRVKVL